MPCFADLEIKYKEEQSGLRNVVKNVNKTPKTHRVKCTGKFIQRNA